MRKSHMLRRPKKGNFSEIESEHITCPGLDTLIFITYVKTWD